MSQPLCYFHNWVREIFENRFFRGSWCSGVVEQESFGTRPCAIQTEICAANRGSIPQKDAATYANGGEPAHYGQNCESPFELRTAVYQKIPVLLHHCTSSLWKTDFFFAVLARWTRIFAISASFNALSQGSYLRAANARVALIGQFYIGSISSAVLVVQLY